MFLREFRCDLPGPFFWGGGTNTDSNPSVAKARQGYTKKGTKAISKPISACRVQNVSPKLPMNTTFLTFILQKALDVWVMQTRYQKDEGRGFCD